LDGTVIGTIACVSLYKGADNFLEAGEFLQKHHSLEDFHGAPVEADVDLPF